MNRLSLLATAILASACSFGAGAAVICEFEPTEDYRDCQKCFKADQNGVQLFVGGKLRASSTSQVLFPSAPVDGQVFQRGIEKVLLSKRNGRKKLFEVCYEKATPMQASDFKLTISGTELEEFEMGRPGVDQGDQYQFAVTAAPAGLRVAFFGTKLVVSPLPGWSGGGVIRYEIIDREGRRSKPGRISLYGRDADVQVPMEHAEVAEYGDASERGLSELVTQLQAAADALALESDTRDGYRNQVDDLERQLFSAQAKLEEIEFQIATAIHAKDRERESYSRHLQALDVAAEGIRRAYISIPALDQLTLRQGSTVAPALPPKRDPVEGHSEMAILQRRMSVIRTLGTESALDLGALRKPISVLARAARGPRSRRLNKKAKKQLRKQRRRDHSTQVGECQRKHGS